VDTIEIEPAMLEGAQQYRYFTEPAYSDPRSHIIVDDAKSYFARSQRRYDAIISEPSNPWVSGVSSLFTREFYKRIRGQLNEGGLLVQWLNLYSFNEPLLASILGALQESFPQYVLYAANNGDLVLVASPSGPVPPLKADIFKLGRLPEYLSRVEINRIEDLAIRRIGDERTARAMLSSLGAPANSDYFPLVDSNAGKARFMNSFVTQLNELSVAPWPVLDMTTKGAMPAFYPITHAKWPNGDRVKEAQQAESARRFLMGELPRERLPVEASDYDRPLTLFKLRYIDCQASTAPMEWWDAAISTAGQVSVYLTPEASDAVWNLVEKSRCAGKLSEEEKRWFALFRAVGRRDIDATSTLSISLLETAEGLGKIEYLYGAMLASLVGAQRFQEAQLLQQRYSGKIPEARQRLGWFRWLKSAAFAGVQ
jgi:spermidine synthase